MAQPARPCQAYEADDAQVQHVIDTVQAWEPVVLINPAFAERLHDQHARRDQLALPLSLAPDRPVATAPANRRPRRPDAANTPPEINNVDRNALMSEDREHPRIENGIEIARVTITRTLVDDNDLIGVFYTDGDGNRLGVFEALTMLRMAEDTVLHPPEGAYDEDEEHD